MHWTPAISNLKLKNNNYANNSRNNNNNNINSSQYMKEMAGLSTEWESYL